MKIIIRQATQTDISGIIHLHDENNYFSIPQNKFKDGFVRTAISEDYLYKIVTNKLAVVASLEERVIGYYLLSDPNFNNQSLDYLIDAAKRYNYLGNPVLNYKIAIGNQACVESKFRRTGLGKELFLEICKLASLNYRLLFGSITKTNIVGFNYNTSFKNAKIVGEDGERWYIIFDLFA